MYDIEELEVQWKRYHRKRLLRRGLLGLAVLLLLALPILYTTLRAPSPVVSSHDDNVRSEVSSAQTSPATTEKNGSKPGPSPSVKTANVQPLSPEVPLQQDTVASSPKKKPKMRITFAGSESPGETSGSEKVEFDMVQRNDEAVVRQIEKRFPVSKDYDDAMYLAKYYYGKKKYKQSEYWAMQANVIDSTQPESWILFGKSKAKRGHRVEALKILQQYYDHTGNQEARLLIDEIRKGKSF